MSDPDFEITSQWKPTPIQETSTPVVDRSGNYKSAVGLATWPLVILAVVGTLFFITAYVPELLWAGPFPDVLEQLRPLSVLALNGVGDVAWTFPLPIALIAAGALSAVARTTLRWNVVLTWLLAVATAGGTAWALLDGGVTAWRDHALALVIGFVLIVCALAVPGRLARSASVAPGKKNRGGGGWATLFALSFVGPLAVGRWLWGEGVPEGAALIATPSRTLGTEATLWFVVVGISFAVALWALVQVFPPWADRKLLQPVVFLIAAVGLGIVLAGQQAATVADLCCR
ncbi:hypothetical protein OG474_41775 [Kribbella sp. NBC_01505]|uniref:hypothetical protein n=1 Tax=Kribbella sp. NBC_01505 TaxID=2903580 RepID=UPI0038690218